MLKIEITIPHPKQTLAFLAVGVIGFWMGMRMVSGWAEGGPVVLEVQAAEGEVRRLRQEQEVLKREENILRGAFFALEEEWNSLPAESRVVVEGDLGEARERLLGLLNNSRNGEEELRTSLYQLWDAQDRARTVARQGESGDSESSIALRWPIEPTRGLSAVFLDAGYEEHFGLQHEAIDIPVPQGTPVRVAMNGRVVEVSDHGFGFNSITVDHGGGLVTLYGHVSGFLVEEGERVSVGEVIALSGGRPGSEGAGHLSTGPHLHFEVVKNGEHVDPLVFLPYRATVVGNGESEKRG